MRDWSKDFNDLPINVREIGQAMECLTRIQHLNREKERLRRSYRRNCAEINDHMRNCESFLKKLNEVISYRELAIKPPPHSEPLQKGGYTGSLPGPAHGTS